jgi:hypothetical protein
MISVWWLFFWIPIWFAVEVGWAFIDMDFGKKPRHSQYFYVVPVAIMLSLLATLIIMLAMGAVKLVAVQ